jgi:L-ribulose-5-phosphate 4-epimerase
MLADLRERVCSANFAICDAGLVRLTWGNVSVCDRDAGAVAIKPSGVDYDDLTPDAIVVVALEDGRPMWGDLRPSSDTPTHLALYRAFPGIGGIVHTHSTHATAWAQARRAIPCYGTTHADHFHGPVPVTRNMTGDEIAGAYEENTGLVIVELFADLDPLAVPAALVAGHGPFAWGASPEAAVANAIVLEEVARIAALTESLVEEARPISRKLLDRHFLRKHGRNAYYGQP